MSTTTKPVRGPAETPLGALKPAGGAPVESHTRGTVRRKPVIRFHARMVRGKLYPLVVQLRDEDGRGGGVAINGDGSHGGTVSVLPVIPGALVAPASVEMSTASGSESRFWVTPMSLGKLRDARVEFRQGARVIESVPLVRGPDWLLVILGLLLTAGIVPILYFLSFSRYIKVRRGWLPWVMLFIAFLLPTLLFMAKRYQWEATVLLIDDRPRPESVRSLIDAEKKDGDAAPPKTVEEGGVINPPAGVGPMGGGATKPESKDQAKPETPKADAEKLKRAEDKKPAEDKKEADKPKSDDATKPDKADPKRDGEDKSKPAEKTKPITAEQQDADDLQASDEDKPTPPAKDEKKPEAAPTSPPRNEPATKTAGGGNRGGGRGGRGGGGGPPGGGGGAGGMMAVPPAPPWAGKPPVMVPYRGAQAIEKWLDQQHTIREKSAFADLDTRDVAILGLVQLKPAFVEAYTWGYDFPRNLQYSEVFLFGVLMVLTIAYWGLFGPVRARAIGQAVEMPAS